MCKKLDYSDYAQLLYEVPPSKYTAERILKILLDASISQSKICTIHPVDITKSFTYVVAISLSIWMILRMTTLESGDTQGLTKCILECK